MLTEQQLTFGPYRLDPKNGQLWRGRQLVRLTSKAFGVLCHLASRPGQLVTKNDLLAAVWPEVVVTEAALTKRIQEVRRALRDDPKAPRYIETVHRQGFRFIGKVRHQLSAVSSQQEVVGARALTLNTEHSTLPIVGRDAELAQLHRWLEQALNGERQLVFVVGEAGIGKTTLVDTFAERVRRAEVWIGQGQCIEQYGPGEAYLPILEALERLGREPAGERAIAILRQYAPSWLVQLPAYVSDEERQQLQRETAGTTQPRMLREIAVALEVLTAEKPLILILEDLHWSDYATMELLAVLARRRENARLAVIGTYRPVDVIVRQHPLREVKQELQLHGLCHEVALDFLTQETVGEYLTLRFGAKGPPDVLFQDVAQIIHDRTDGNPLFMVNVVNDLVRHGVLLEANGGWVLKEEADGLTVGIPDTLRQLIEQQLGRVSLREMEVLEAASIAGAKFSAAVVSAGIQTEVETAERHCQALVRREQFLQSRGIEEWPDGTLAACYGFVHALYQEVLSDRVPGARRVGLHQRIGERLKAGYGVQVGGIAAQLAVHFEEGRDYRRAIQYRHQAAGKAVQRHAYQEAIDHLTTGLELLKVLPSTPERTQQELTLQVTLGPTLMAARGFAAPEVEEAYNWALELCQQMEDKTQLFSVLAGLMGFSMTSGKLHRARELGEQLLSLAQPMRSPGLLLWTYYMSGETLFYLGELVRAREHLAQAIALYDPQKHRSYTSRGAQDPGVACLSVVARTLWHLGYPDQALEKIQEAVSLTQELFHPFSQAFALLYAAVVHEYRQEVQAVQEQTEALIALCTEQGFPLLLTRGTIYQGWALAEQGQAKEGIAQMRQGLASDQASGTQTWRPYYLALLAEAYGKVGQMEEGLSLLTEALAAVDKTGERACEAEVYRLKGELLLNGERRMMNDERQTGQARVLPPTAEAEACFQAAIEIARRQSAKSWELRAAMSLAHLWQQQGEKTKAHELLAPVYHWFTEGFDTKDLQEAKALLEELK